MGSSGVDLVGRSTDESIWELNRIRRKATALPHPMWSREQPVEATAFNCHKSRRYHEKRIRCLIQLKDELSLFLCNKMLIIFYVIFTFAFYYVSILVLHMMFFCSHIMKKCWTKKLRKYFLTFWRNNFWPLSATTLIVSNIIIRIN